MEFTRVRKEQWPEVKALYLEAFPKAERKPFAVVKHTVKKGKAQLWTAADAGILLGYVMVIPCRDMVMVDYLAVSGKIRGRGAGSLILGEIDKTFPGKRIVLLIERLDEQAENRKQRIARKRFYEKNGYASAGLFTTGAGGDMEVMAKGGAVSAEDYMALQRYALGRLMFRLSRIKLMTPPPVQG